MKNAVLAIVALFCFTLTFNANAQLTKQEKKEWKKQMKALDVESFKKLVEEKESLESEVASLNSQVSSLQSRANDKSAEAEKLSTQVKDLQNQLAEAQAAAQAAAQAQQDPNNTDISGNSTRVAKGVAFKVQIGAFRNKDLAKYFANNGSFDGEVDNSTQRYTLGTFTDYWEADKFKKYLREMGVKDAWIVAYKDGQRVPLKDVLEGVI